MTHVEEQVQTLGVQHVPWQDPIRLPVMSNTEDQGGRFRITSRYLEVNGAPAIPV